ncbi:hypothetical protein [Capnocytophaga gingivalis]|uniref:Uncharacterized protein n=1 Tax=Capnocytophaga gingivalis TaxID=1017 RepID=A0ABU5YBI7_9FLAO|nr:hypothetical protein [Capnocytophaga gingivalis]MEB3041316.1 hypothetical protein [Capnocytophaga gingivalis]
MKTVFKEGMEVWDKTISPNKGKVIEVFTDYKYDFPIKVEFEDGLKVQYTNDGCFVKSKGAINTLSTSNYSIDFKGFEQKAPAPTYEEAEEWIRKEHAKGNNHLMSKNVLEALRRLVILRDYYNEGWQPKNSSYVHIITTRNGELVKDCLMGDFRVLYFESMEIRNTFFEEQKELLEIAKPLL